MKNCQRRKNKVSGRSNHSVILGGARPLKNYHRKNKISGSLNHRVYSVVHGDAKPLRNCHKIKRVMLHSVNPWWCQALEEPKDTQLISVCYR